MGWRFSRFHRFRVFKTPMGLDWFEVRFFFEERFTKIDIAPKEVIKNHWKVGYRQSMMFLTISLNNFFLSKVLWEHHSIENFWHTIFFFSFGIDPRKVPISKTASLRSKTFRYDSLETREFLWVKTRMGIQVHFLDFFGVFVSEF